MAFRKRSTEVALALQDDGLLVSGTSEGLDVIAQQLRATPGRVRQAPQGAVDALGGAASLLGLAKTNTTYFKLSADSMRAVRANGGLPAGGTISGVLRGDGQKILKHLEFNKALVSPGQALSLQTMAIGLAIRIAIADVQEAVERVEGKVDQVVELLRSDRLGHALGDHRVLSTMVERLRDEGSLSTTDWDTVDSIGHGVVQGIEGLRAHVRLMIDKEIGGSTRSRAGVAESLLDGQMFKETLALSVLSEHNHFLWQELRIAHVRDYEPAHLASAVASAREALTRDQADDQQMLSGIAQLVAELTEPRGFEGLAPLQRRKLQRSTAELTNLAAWFADQRLLDLPALESVQWPSPRESVEHVWRSARTTVTGAARSAKTLVRRSDRDGESPPTDPPALESREPEEVASRDPRPLEGGGSAVADRG